MADGDSTKVVYKIRQWSLPGATVVPVLNVSSRVFWLELDDKALLILSVGSLHALVFCFTRFSPSPGLVKLPCVLQSTGMR